MGKCGQVCGHVCGQLCLSLCVSAPLMQDLCLHRCGWEGNACRLLVCMFARGRVCKEVHACMCVCIVCRSVHYCVKMCSCVCAKNSLRRCTSVKRATNGVVRVSWVDSRYEKKKQRRKGRREYKCGCEKKVCCNWDGRYLSWGTETS